MMARQGFRIHNGYFDGAAQLRLVVAVREILVEAPLYTPRMPRTGNSMSVRMSNCGPLGWVTDKDKGYRYEPRHPVTGQAWPPMPQMLTRLWRELTEYTAPPEACLINYYGPKARLTLHLDQDEADLTAPIVSISLGDTAVFRMGGENRRGPTSSVRLVSGDVVVMEEVGRRSYHGIDRIIAGSSTLVEEGGRFNLTLRRVNTA